MAVKWKWNNNTGGGNVPAGLENRVQTLETDNTQNKTNITNLQTNTVKITGDQNIEGAKTFKGSTTFGREIKAGWGGNPVKFLPDSGTKTLQFYNNNPNDTNRFNLLVPEPSQAQAPATKQYVDNRIRYRVVDIVINNNQQSQINPTSGYRIINIRVGRKRTSEGYFFFDHNISLNFQTFIHTNGNFVVYNNGGVAGFDNNFKILITEMKV